MPSNNLLRVGIVGAGWAAEGHAFAYDRCAETITVAICNRTQSTAEKVAQRYQIPNIFSDYQQMFQEDLDIVAITTPAHTHCQIAVDALNAGAHVICEKPMTLNAEEALKMYQVANKKNLKTAIAFNWRYTPEFMHLKKLIDDGHIGEVQEIHAHWLRGLPKEVAVGWFTRLEQGGGFLANGGAHEIDRVRCLLGCEPKRVCGKTIHTLKHGYVVPDTNYFLDRLAWRPGKDEPLDNYQTEEITADMGYYFLADFGNSESNKNETMAVFRSGSARGRGPRSIEVFGNNGSLVLEDNQLLGCPLDKQEFEPIYLPVNSSDLASNQLELLNYLWTEMVEDFIRSIRQVETSVPTFYDGLKGQQVIDAVRLSGRENKWIQLT